MKRDALGRFIKGQKPENFGKGYFKIGHTINNGKHRSMQTEFKKNHIAWNKGTKGLMIAWNKGKGNGYINSHGYKIICLNNKEIPEHRILMEKYLGRKLTNKEHIHHINGNRNDNRIENMMILTHREHMRLHYPEKSHKFRRRKNV